MTDSTSPDPQVDRLRSWFEHTSEALFCYEYNPPIPTDLPVEEQIRRLYEGVLVECNGVAAGFYGASEPQEVLGRGLTDLFQASPHALDDFFRAFIQGGYELTDADAPENLPDGSLRHFRNRGLGVVVDGKLTRVWGSFREVTKEKDAQAASLAGEAQFRAFMNHLPAVAYIKDQDHRYVTVNGAVTELLGLDVGDVVGTTIDELIPDASTALKAAEAKVFTTGRPHPPFEWSLPTQGGVRWLREYKFPIDLPDGTRLLGGVAVDVTRERKAREQVAAERDRSQLYLDNAEVMLLALNSSGRIEMINRRGAEVLGYREQELIGRDWFGTCIPKKGRKEVREVFQQLMKGDLENVEFFENQVETKAGDLRTIAFRNALIRGPKGAIGGTFSSGEDVTGLRESEKALRESERRFREMAELLPEAVFEADIDLNLVYANQRAFQMTGYSEEDLGRGLNGLQLVVPEDLPRIAENLKKRIQGEDLPAAEYTMVRKDGTKLPVLFHAAIIRKNGEPGGVRGVFVDLSATLQREEELRQSLQYSADLARAIPSGLFIYEFRPPHELFLLYANPEAEKLTGVRLEESKGLEFNQIWPMAKEQGITESFLRVMRTGETYRTHELAYEDDRLSGAYRVHAFPLPGGRLAVSFEDVTARLEAELALKTSEERLRLALRAGGLGLYDLDLRTGKAVVNEEYETMLGFAPGELEETNEKWIDRLHPDDAERVSRAYQDYVSGTREDYSVEFRQRRKDGSWIWILSIGEILERDEDGNPLRMLGVHLDVNDRKESEAALTRSESRYRGLVEHATYGIYRSDTEGRFSSANPALADMLGYDSEEDLMGIDLSRDLYWNPEDRDRLVAEIEECGRIVGSEVRWKRKDGVPITVRLSARAILDAQGKPEAFETIAEDVSQRIALEDQLRQAQKMEAVGELTGGIAHDFNNVLAVILLNAELMAGSLEDGLEILPEDVHAIQNAAKRASAITGKLLGFSRRAELEMVPLDAGRVVEGFEPVLRTLLPERIRLEMDVAGTCPPVRADAGSIEQIVLNLVTNSRDAIHDTGEIKISVEEQFVEEAYARSRPGMKRGQFVSLEVSDTGAGMDQETINRIFDPFFTTKALGAGTGLGMAMVYGLTKQQGGYVEVTSRPGEGTRSRVLLPVTSDEPVQRGGGAGGTEFPSGEGTILLVEDDDLLREVTTTALTRHGYSVLAAPGAEEGLELVAERREEIDLVFSDLALPGMNGLELFHALRSAHGPLRFILATGYSGAHAADLEGLNPSVPLLLKPWALHDLLSTVQSVMKAEPPESDPD